MAYTGRLAHPNARPANIKLGFWMPVAPPQAPRPWPDMNTTVELGTRVTTLEVSERTASLEVSERRTSVTPDE